jgi:pyruvate formate lyase activating enzyme
MRKAWFVQAVPRGVVCTLCARQCLLREGERGPCGLRECADGELVTRASERVGRVVPRRIEALGLYHVLPGSRALTAAFCEPPQPDAPRSRGDDSELHTYAIEELPELARRAGCRGVAFGYVEPTYALESLVPALEIARGAGLLAVLQTAGAMSAEVAQFLAPRLDAVSLHLSTLTESTALRRGHVGPQVLRDNVRRLREAGVWVETSTLLEPGVNDSQEELLEIALSLRAIDAAIPWHVRCIPAAGEGGLLERWAETATERALEAGARAGLEYVYAADAPGSDRELTFCPVCRDVVLIERFQGEPKSFLAEGIRCPRCRTRAHGLFHPRARPIAVG